MGLTHCYKTTVFLTFITNNSDNITNRAQNTKHKSTNTKIQ